MTHKTKHTLTPEEHWKQFVSLVVCVVVIGAVVYMWKVTNTYESSLHGTPTGESQTECAQMAADGLFPSYCAKWGFTEPVTNLSASECFQYRDSGRVVPAGCMKYGIK